MAAAVYSTDLVDIIAEMPSSTGWTLITDSAQGANSFSVPETDDFVQGANCISRNPWTAASTKGMVYNSAQTITAGDAVWIWYKADVAQALRTKANGGLQALVGSSTSDLKCFYVDGSDTYTFGGWKCVPIDPTLTASFTLGTPTTSRDYFGFRWGVAVSGPSKGFPYKIDAIRRGRTLQIVSGDVGNGYATFDAAATFQNDIGRQWGQLQRKDGTYLQQGLLLLGTDTTAVDFRDSNRVIFIAATDFVGSTFNTIEVRHASSRVDWTNISIAALGTVSRGRFLMTNNAIVNQTSCVFSDMSTFTYLSNAVVTSTIFRRCDTVTPGGGTFSGCTFDDTLGATTAVSAATPANGALISNSTFVSGGTKHGLTITGTAANITLTNNTWTGYTGSNGSTGNEAIFVNIASGSMNITISGGTTPSIRTAGCVVTVISGAVSVSAKAVTEAGANLAGAAVHLEATAGGPFPVAAAVTITNAGTTATVAHTLHGLATNDKVVIRGASHIPNLGVFSITVTTVDAYTYVMASDPGSSPTGTITATFVVLSGTTDVSGNISMSRVFPSAQPVTGRIRKSSGAPFYKNATLVGTVSSTTGAAFTGVMISDD